MRALLFDRYHTTKVEAGTTSLGVFAPLQLPRMSLLALCLALVRPAHAALPCKDGTVLTNLRTYFCSVVLRAGLWRPGAAAGWHVGGAPRQDVR